MAFSDIFKSNKKGGGVIAPPRHIAIIMDGNGRWAKKRGLRRSAGHAAGAENFRRIARACSARGVEYLTVYAFSTENWTRPAPEVESILELLAAYLKEALETIEKERIHVRFIGDMSVFSLDVREMAAELERVSQKFETNLHLNICVNYGGRNELINAARELAKRAASGELDPNTIGDAALSSALYTAGLPDPDILIRPGGEKRISNFLLWQLAYTEFFFLDTLWPDFHEHELDRIIAEYSLRNRRHGGL